MRVLHVLPSLREDSGGPAKSVPQLCKALADKGVRIRLFVLHQKDALAQNKEVENGLELKSHQAFPGTLQLPRYETYQALSREIRSSDVVNLHSLWNPFTSLAAFVCRQEKIPYVLSPMGMLRDAAMRKGHLKKKLYYSLIEKYTISGARCLNFFNVADKVESLRNVRDIRRAELIPNGTNYHPRDRGSFRSKHPAFAANRIMLFLGRIHWSKNLVLQLQGFALLARRHPDLVWVLVGPDGGEWRKLEDQIKRIGLADRVYWVGLQSHLACLDALADADVSVLTSHHEGHSMAMNEALMSGTPLVLTKSVGFPVAEEEGAAICVESEPGSLADAVTCILESPELSRRLGTAAQKLVEQKFNWQAVADALITVYRDVITTSPANRSSTQARNC